MRKNFLQIQMGLKKIEKKQKMRQKLKLTKVVILKKQLEVLKKSRREQLLENHRLQTKGQVLIRRNL